MQDFWRKYDFKKIKSKSIRLVCNDTFGVSLYAFTGVIYNIN